MYGFQLKLEMKVFFHVIENNKDIVELYNLTTIQSTLYLSKYKDTSVRFENEKFYLFYS